MIDLSVIAPALSLLWTDSMDIIGYTSVKGDDGVTDPNVEVSKASGVPCKIGFKKPDGPDAHEVDRDPKNMIPKIVCAVDVPIAKGDYITAYKKTVAGQVLATYTGRAGLPEMGQSHQQFEIRQDGEA